VQEDTNLSLIEDASLSSKIYCTLQSTLYKYVNIILSASCKAGSVVA
jgi:hypothetical protein